MENRQDHPVPDRIDWLIALVIGAGALAVYVRTLAPDILYSDSAEFQTLGFTLGLAHPTGYPVYLLLTYIASFIPIGPFAWRVNLISAIAGAGTVALVYLLGQYLTRSRAAAVLGSLALLLSYTLWSQAIIAEIYTMGTLWVVIVTWLLWHWSGAPTRRQAHLFLAALLSGLSPGIHLFATLIAPAAILLVIQVLRQHEDKNVQWWRLLAPAVLGTISGVALLIGAFLIIGAIDSPTSYNHVTLLPSRDLWDLEKVDMDTPWERIYLSFYSPQWRVRMFPGGISFMLAKAAELVGRLFAYEFSVTTLAGAVIGLILMRRQTPRLGSFVHLALATVIIAIINYDPGDKHIFYLPAYVLLALAAAAGAGVLLDTFKRPGHRWTAVRYLLSFILVVLIGQGFWSSRWQALQDRRATFVRETYPYPVDDLNEPRRIAEEMVSALPGDAVLIMGWQALYATSYVAHVAEWRPGLTIMEATPFGSDGRVADTLIEQMVDALEDERQVFADRRYPNLERHFRLRPVAGSLYELSLR